MTTMACGTTAPLGSKTVPVMPPRFVCVNATAAQSRAKAERRMACIVATLPLHQSNVNTPVAYPNIAGIEQKIQLQNDARLAFEYVKRQSRDVLRLALPAPAS